MSRPTVHPRQSTREYWQNEVAKFFREASSTTPVERMDKDQRLFFTRNKNGQLQTRDPHSVQILIEQAMLTLEAAGYEQDEVHYLRNAMENAAPKAPGSRFPPTPELDKTAVRYFYERMTGENDPELKALSDIFGQDFSIDLAAHVEWASHLSQQAHDDAKHRINKSEAYSLLRDFFGLHGKNAVGDILKH